MIRTCRYIDLRYIANINWVQSFGKKQRNIQTRKQASNSSEVTMAQDSAIEWTDATWTPVTGCTKISPGCKNCYAERLAFRLKEMGNPRYKDGFRLTLHPDQIDLPLRWGKRKMIFVNSMSDLFHESVPDEYIKK